MRCFIAINIDEQIQKALGYLQKELQSKVDIRKGDVKWIEPENIHLTVNFLGEIKDEQTVEVCNITKDVASRYKSFDMEVKKVGCFGGKSARVLWVGAGEDCESLLQLQQELELNLDEAGWPMETRKFSAHLTLCRIRNSKAGFKLAQLVNEYTDYTLGTTSADSVTVYQSQLTSQGPVYTILGNYELK
jgi:2'-5' RNA ligase